MYRYTMDARELGESNSSPWTNLSVLTLWVIRPEPDTAVHHHLSLSVSVLVPGAELCAGGQPHLRPLLALLRGQKLRLPFIIISLFQFSYQEPRDLT